MFVKKVSSFILLVFSAFYSFGQNVNIYVCPLTHDHLMKSMVCVSKADGTSLFEYVLTPDDIENGSEYHLTIEDPSHYCFSIINQYQFDTINEGRPFLWCKTYYDMSKDLHLYNFDHPQIQSWYPERTVTLTLHDVPEIEHWQHDTDATYSSFKQNGKDIWSITSIRPGEDLFVIMKAIKDPKYRYLYVPADAIPYHNIEQDWRFLKTDLQHISVDLPFETEFIGTISAKNNSTGNNCMFYAKEFPDKSRHIPENSAKYYNNGPQLPPENNKLEIFIPAQNLSGYYANLRWGSWLHNTEYEYRIRHGYELSFPKYSENLFQPEYFINDTLGIRARLNSFSDNFRILFEGGFIERPVIGMRINQIVQSSWIVIGKNNGDIHFKLPAISEDAKAEFFNFGRWYFSYLENVKFLEQDTNIDWINFFRDYNVLLVRSRYSPK